ncbi:hypothetical protein WG908_03405 [Sphingobium sp. AN641]|uniref:hypothetical protein n=1 Tax=Sphingobium sp. AN641 TaxID=3133443 RepID=UPI0030BEB7AC
MMRDARHLLSYAWVAFVLLLASCATPPPYVPPPQVIPTVMPLPPMGAAENMDLPDADEQGRYITPNRGMTGQQALWHVRMALNVAALSCHGSDRAMATQYNRMLHTHSLALSQANIAADAIYALKYGVNATLMREKVNTIVYNYFALPPAQKAFCQTALAVVTTINGLTPQALFAYAPQALDMLEKPFQQFWEAYADYLRRLEEWRRRFGRPSVKVLPCPDSDPDCTGTSPPPPPAAPAGAYPIPPEQLQAVPPSRMPAAD